MGPTIFFAKISILLLYLRIFTVNKLTRYAIYFGMAFTALLYWAGVGVESYFCAAGPGESWADIAVLGAKCSRLLPWGITQGICVVVLDVYILILPIPVVIQLHLPMRKRLAILGVFTTASLQVIIRVREQQDQSHQIIIVASSQACLRCIIGSSSTTSPTKCGISHASSFACKSSEEPLKWSRV